MAIYDDSNGTQSKPQRECKVWYCQNQVYAVGYCNKHYNVWLRSGIVPSPHNEDLQTVLHFIECMAEPVRAFVKAYNEETTVEYSTIARMEELLAVMDGKDGDTPQA